MAPFAYFAPVYRCSLSVQAGRQTPRVLSGTTRTHAWADYRRCLADEISPLPSLERRRAAAVISPAAHAGGVSDSARGAADNALSDGRRSDVAAP